MGQAQTYLGAFGYNETPTELGGTEQVWQFADYAALEAASMTSGGLNEGFPCARRTDLQSGSGRG